MNASLFRGTTVALVTPFDVRGALDEEALRRLVDWHLEERTDVILGVGTTGEGATLTIDESRRVLEIIIQRVDGRIPVLCGAGSNSTAEAIRLARRCEGLGGDGILSVGPYYNKPTQEGFYQHFKAIAEATELPLILYNVPSRTGSNISAETTLRLAQVPNIVAIKEASGDLSQIMQIIRRRPDGFLVLSGDDAFTLPLLSLGGDGAISVVANEVPGMMRRMVAAALAGEWETARKLHYQMLPLMDVNFIESNPIPVKEALKMMGRIGATYRSPLVPMSSSNREALHKVLVELGLIR